MSHIGEHRGCLKQALLARKEGRLDDAEEIEQEAAEAWADAGREAREDEAAEWDEGGEDEDE